MIQRPNLRYLLLPLLGTDCLEELLLEYDPKTQSLFYDCNDDRNLILLMKDNHVEVEEFKFNKKLKIKDENYKDHLNYSRLSLPGKRNTYQLEKGSIIWKINIKELKQKSNLEEHHIKKLVCLFNDQLTEFKHLINQLMDDQAFNIVKLKRKIGRAHV